MQNQLTSFGVLSNPDLMRAVQAHYEEAEAERKRLHAELVALRHEMKRLNQAYQLKQAYDIALDQWVMLSRDEQRGLLYAFVQGIDHPYRCNRTPTPVAAAAPAGRGKRRRLLRPTFRR